MLSLHVDGLEWLWVRGPDLSVPSVPGQHSDFRGLPAPHEDQTPHSITNTSFSEAGLGRDWLGGEDRWSSEGTPMNPHVGHGDSDGNAQSGVRCPGQALGPERVEILEAARMDRPPWDPKGDSSVRLDFIIREPPASSLALLPSTRSRAAPGLRLVSCLADRVP